jgi:hypothetical protein
MHRLIPVCGRIINHSPVCVPVTVLVCVPLQVRLLRQFLELLLTRLCSQMPEAPAAALFTDVSSLVVLADARPAIYATLLAAASSAVVFADARHAALE